MDSFQVIIDGSIVPENYRHPQTARNKHKSAYLAGFQGHPDNINRLADEGKLIVAGPPGENTRSYRGTFIPNNINFTEQAKKLLLTDPAIENGLPDYEIYSWYESAALPTHLPSADKNKAHATT